jgi:hypothetical protein
MRGIASKLGRDRATPSPELKVCQSCAIRRIMSYDVAAQ